MAGARLFLVVLVKLHPFSVPQLPSCRMGHISTSQVLGDPAQKQWPLSLQDMAPAPFSGSDHRNSAVCLSGQPGSWTF